MIDLRSDIVIRLSRVMFEAMMVVSVGDDVYGDDFIVNVL